MKTDSAIATAIERSSDKAGAAARCSTAKVYVGAPKRWSRKRAQELGEAVEAIGEVVTPIDVVEAASNPKSPLHSEFEWDDSAAAQKFRLVQARRLLNHLHIELQINGQDASTKAFISLSVSESEEEDSTPGRAYYRANDVARSKRLTAQYRADLLRELESLKRKYSQWAGPIAQCIRRIK